MKNLKFVPNMAFILLKTEVFKPLNFSKSSISGVICVIFKDSFKAKLNLLYVSSPRLLNFLSIFDLNISATLGTINTTLGLKKVKSLAKVKALSVKAICEPDKTGEITSVLRPKECQYGRIE